MDEKDGAFTTKGNSSWELTNIYLECGPPGFQSPPGLLHFEDYPGTLNNHLLMVVSIG